MSELSRIEIAVAHIRSKLSSGLQPRVGIVLGSGLGALADSMEIEVALPYQTIPGFLSSTVEGHAGKLCLGTLGGVPAAVMQGRIHLYEGHPEKDVVFPVRVLCRMGVEALVVTNAAGGIDRSFSSGEMMLLTDHLNLTGRNPLMGENDEAIGPRFPDMSVAYEPSLRAIAHEVAAVEGFELREGVYAGLLGPTYETPAEVRMLRTLGASAVGMSTVLEVIAARHMGVPVLGLSVISNLAAGLSLGPLSHDEVKETADRVQDRVLALIRGFGQRLLAS
jgi:purine-nucleoside phosphorylase